MKDLESMYNCVKDELEDLKILFEVEDIEKIINFVKQYQSLKEEDLKEFFICLLYLHKNNYFNKCYENSISIDNFLEILKDDINEYSLMAIPKERVNLYMPGVFPLAYIKDLCDYCGINKKKNKLLNMDEKKNEIKFPVFPYFDYMQIYEDVAALENHSDFYDTIKTYLHYETEISFNRVVYKFIIPKDPADVLKEAYFMRNCISRRMHDIINGKIKVIFMRKYDKPEEPFVDIILDHNNNVLWAIEKQHVPISGDILSVVENFLSNINKRNQ